MTLLEEAERVYRALGVLPLHIAAALIEAGYIVEKLEKRWGSRK